MPKFQTHHMMIGNCSYHIHGGDTETLKDIAKKLDIKYDILEPSPISPDNPILKIWKIGELADYLKTSKKEIKDNQTKFKLS